MEGNMNGLLRRLIVFSSKRVRFNILTGNQIRSLTTPLHIKCKFENERLETHSGSLKLSLPLRSYSKKISDGAKNVINFFEFSEIEDKSKRSFVDMISMYEIKFKSRKGVVDFIYAALREMKEFGVAEDLEAYKRLVDLMPKGPYLPTSRLQVETMYFPREQDCILELLSQMEEFGVMPDVEMGEILSAIFGEIGIPTRKFYRMMYWMPKFKYKSPWPVEKPLPKETFTLAKMAIERITSVDLQTEITVFRTEDVNESLDKTWIISGQSPVQKELLRNHDREKPLIVEGGDHVWIGNKRVNYFLLKSEDITLDEPPKSINDFENFDIRFFNPNYVEKKERSVHEQEDGIIYGVCATGTSEKDSLLSWIRLLERHGNPTLGELAVLFRFKQSPDEVVTFSDTVATQGESIKST